MTATNPSWIDGLALDGYKLRRIDSALTMHNGNALGARSGIIPGTGGFGVSIAGSTITVGSGIAVVYYAGEGVFRAPMTSSSTLTLTAAHATLPRVDLVYLRIWCNSVDASGLNQADCVYLAGTAAASPVAPTPAGTLIYMPLATINVPASGGGSPTVSQAVLPYTVAPGGILPLQSSAPPSPYTGQFYDNGTDLLRYNGSSWDTYQKVPGAWTPYTPVWTGSGTNPSVGANGTLIGRYQKFGRTVIAHINLTCGSNTTYGSGHYNFTIPFAAANVGASLIGNAMLLGTDRWNGEINISPGATTLAAFFPLSATNNRTDFMTPTRPETLATGAQLRMTFQYESAT
ncbi:hypothetical protein ACFRIC_09395 [Streptomyces sp. NPDC056738]|uniref:hypothetical protein n=1 Tax=Streptomyces sp. NPDC056738 TaxID=3345933 RepID=UPI003687EEFA